MVRKIGSGSSIALHQLADRIDFVRIVLEALFKREHAYVRFIGHGAKVDAAGVGGD